MPAAGPHNAEENNSWVWPRGLDKAEQCGKGSADQEEALVLLWPVQQFFYFLNNTIIFFLATVGKY